MPVDVGHPGPRSGTSVPVRGTGRCHAVGALAPHSGSSKTSLEKSSAFGAFCYVCLREVFSPSWDPEEPFWTLVGKSRFARSRSGTNEAKALRSSSRSGGNKGKGGKDPRSVFWVPLGKCMSRKRRPTLMASVCKRLIVGWAYFWRFRLLALPIATMPEAKRRRVAGSGTGSTNSAPAKAIV